MTRKELKEAVKIAVSDVSLSEVDDDHLFGYELPSFKKTVSTIQAIAKMIRWQCVYLNGKICENSLNELFSIFKNKVTVVHN